MPPKKAAAIRSSGAGSAVRDSTRTAVAVSTCSFASGEDEDVEPAHGGVGEAEDERVVAEDMRAMSAATSMAAMAPSTSRRSNSVSM